MSTELNVKRSSEGDLEVRIHFTEEDVNCICWVGDRYCWASELGKFVFEAGEVVFSDADVSQLVEAFEEDTVGGHRMFPCINPGSDLSKKMGKLYSVYTTKEF